MTDLLESLTEKAVEHLDNDVARKVADRIDRGDPLRVEGRFPAYDPFQDNEHGHKLILAGGGGEPISGMASVIPECPDEPTVEVEFYG